LKGQAFDVPPAWLMRQAGRYLPEYRATRAEAGGFLKLCYTPKLAAEVTFQPIRRYGFDAAILFSDILVVPDALGQKLAFAEGEGPVLEPVRSAADLGRLSLKGTTGKFETVAETVALLRAGLPAETALIGFCGAPWTVATYMVEGGGSKEHAAARLWAYGDPQGFQRLIDIIVAASIDYLGRQVVAGADALQIFDTWAGALPEDQFQKWVIAPTRAIVDGVRKAHPDVPIIGFPRGIAGSPYLAQLYVRGTGVNGLGFDTVAPVSAMAKAHADLGVTVQGNLDPLLLVAGGRALDHAVDALLAGLKGRPFIFNLGHGIVPQTPPEHVAQLMARVRSGQA
jgi:uroporphyrinogen decarboxylase